MEKVKQYLQAKIAKRQAKNYLRELPVALNGVDFCSNDYLGLARSIPIRNRIRELSKEYKLASTGSRLISGNTPLAETLEQQLATFFKAEAALLFNSGYDANIGLIGSIAQEGDTILYDYLCHASIRDGLKLSRANVVSFHHNDLQDLSSKLASAKGNIFIVIESIYSMDGDASPLEEIVRLAQNYQAAIIIDEAHSTAIYGDKGAGFVIEKGLEEQLFARVHTFGKAFGAHGAVVLGSSVLKQYLINYARSFIFTTALPPHSLLHIQAVLEELKSTNTIDLLKNNIAFFKKNLAPQIRPHFISSNSPIQSMLIGGNTKTKQIAQELGANGFDIRPILYPSVPLGKERLRICLHAFNTKDELEKLCDCLNKIQIENATE